VERVDITAGVDRPMLKPVVIYPQATTVK